MMTILHLTWGLDIGGKEQFLYQLVRRCDASQWAHHIWTLRAKGFYYDRLQAEGYPLQWFGKKAGFDVAALLRVRRALRELHPDVIHAHEFTSTLVAVLARMGHDRPPIAASLHGGHLGLHPLKRALFPRLLRRTQMVIAVSRHLAGTIQSRIGNAVAVRIVPYGLDLNRFQGSADRAALRRALDLTPDQPVAIMVARLEAPKDYPLLIAAAQLVCRAVPDCVFLAVGDGSQRAALAAMAEQAGLGRSVRFLGARSDVPELLQLADIGVLTSRREGLPLAILEYMASGKPVVASAVGGVGEMVHDGLEGYLLRSARAEECAGRILQLLRDPAQARAMGARGRALVERQFSLSTMVQTYSALYHHLAATNRDARPAATP